MTETLEGSEDVRVQRSRLLLRQALFELAVEKGYAAITVRDIATRAKVNRSTFYRHYLDKDDLLNQYLDQLHTHVSAAALRAEGTSSAAREQVPSGLLLLVRHVQEHAAFYRVMLSKRGDLGFTDRFRQLSEQRYRYLFSRRTETTTAHATPVEMQLRYISSAFVGAVVWWLENSMPSTAEQFARWLGQLSMTTAGITMQQLEQSPS